MYKKSRVFVVLTALFLLIKFDSFSQVNNIEKSSSLISGITMINRIQYTDTLFETPHPGCSFLIDIGSEILAVTCKHTFWENKPLEMNTIYLNNRVKEWRMYRKDDKTKFIIIDRLINEDSAEEIGEWNTDKDYLVFTIKENKSDVKPLKLFPGKMRSGDTLYSVGWSFKDGNIPAQVVPSLFHSYSGPSILIKDLKQTFLPGRSGSPVITGNNELVGIISTWKFDQKSSSWYGAPCSIDYLWQVIFKYWATKNGKSKDIKSFQNFIFKYEIKIKCKISISDFLIKELFFSDWLKFHKIKFPVRADFLKLKESIKNGISLSSGIDPYVMNEIKFDAWKYKFLNNKAGINNLKKDTSIHADMMMLSTFGLDLIKSGQNQKALEILTFAKNEFPNNGQVFAFLGDAYLALGNKNRALENYKKCLQLYPGYPYANDRIRKLF